MNYKARTELIGELLIMKAHDIKPNFSELARIYGFDRATVRKYYKDGGLVIKERSTKSSKYDSYKDEIIELMSKPGVSISALYHYLINKYEKIPFTYSGLKSYTLRLGFKRGQAKNIPHLRYETPPGEQLQVDWKENLSITTKHSEIIEFNIFSATLGYSRLHFFIYTKGKTEQDFLRCLITVLNKLGGKPQIVKTDNMSAIVSIKESHRKKHSIIKQFESDTGIKISLCEVRSPETKGKVEVSNKFTDWLKPYDGLIEGEAGLIEAIDIITKQANNEINQTTKIPPIRLFEKEKEHLLPLPTKILLDSYIENIDTQKVPTTLLVNYKGNGYSVPSKLIGQRVKLIPIDDKLYIYFNTDLIICHTIKNQRFNYDPVHYTDALSIRLKDKGEAIEKMAMDNLRRFGNMKGNN